MEVVSNEDIAYWALTHAVWLGRTQANDYWVAVCMHHSGQAMIVPHTAASDPWECLRMAKDEVGIIYTPQFKL